MKFRKRKNKWLLYIIMIFFITWKNINYIGNNLIDKIENIVKSNVNKGVYKYVFNMLDRDILEDEELMNVIKLTLNSEDEVVSVDYNFSLAYKYLTDGMNNLYDNLTNIQIDTDYDKREDGIFFVPVGLAYNNMLLDYLGFKIPCKVNYISDVDMGFKTKVSDYGLNNLLIELYLCINVKNELMSPSSFYTFGESYELIIASKIVMGRIPNYLGDTIEKSSSIVSS